MPSGLRERKKLRTRATLIEAAAELCIRQGYDKTTVDQIAAVADVSPRTFSRYFTNKESVVTAIADDMDTYIAAALEHQPADITEYEALLRAHLEVFGAEKYYPTPGFTRMAVLIQIVNSSASFKTSALTAQRELSEQTAAAVIGRRLGVAPGHPAIQVITDTWTVLFARSFVGLGQPGDDPITAKIVCERLVGEFELFRRSWSPWHEAHDEPGQAAGV